MGGLVYDRTWLREPRLMGPRLAPCGPVRPNLAHPLYAAHPILVLPPYGVVTRAWRPQPLAAHNGAAVLPCSNGLAYRTEAATSQYFSFGSAIGPTSLPFCAFLVGVTVAIGALQCSASTCTKITNRSGIQGFVAAGGVLNFQFGDGSGAGPTDRRTAAGDTVLAAGQPFAASCECTAATAWRMWVNGTPQSVTVSGTATAFSNTGGVLSIGRFLELSAYYDSRVLLFGVTAALVPDAVHEAFGRNPFALFSPA